MDLSALGFNWENYWFAVLGIVISLVLPIIKQYIPDAQPKMLVTRGHILTELRAIWNKARPFIAIGLFSMITAFLILAVLNNLNLDVRSALLAGYAWDSTLQKMQEKD